MRHDLPFSRPFPSADGADSLADKGTGEGKSPMRAVKECPAAVS